ncbi:MAG: hypothetical protein MJA29_08045 [Candidatus Omnitrophica bacterium]|nr:hypothetical protein [Candidatus Omnitrophota bacterium]
MAIMKKEPNSTDRLFGTLAVSMFILAFLGFWIIEAAQDIFYVSGRYVSGRISSDNALGFSGAAIFLALLFGVIGWRHKAGKVTVLTIGALLSLLLVAALIYGIMQAQTGNEKLSVNPDEEIIWDDKGSAEKNKQMDYSPQQTLNALRNADAAGDTAAARRIVKYYKSRWGMPEFVENTAKPETQPQPAPSEFDAALIQQESSDNPNAYNEGQSVTGKPQTQNHTSETAKSLITEDE